MAEAYTLREATVGDAPALAAQRRSMFEAMGLLAPAGGEEARQLEQVSRRFIEEALPAGAFFAWVVEHAGQPVAGGGVLLRTLMPRPGYVDGGTEAYVLSMWTDPAHRRRGLARRIVRAILDWCATRGIRRVTLHASDQGRPLYETFGFHATNEMRLDVP